MEIPSTLNSYDGPQFSTPKVRACYTLRRNDLQRCPAPAICGSQQFAEVILPIEGYETVAGWTDRIPAGRSLDDLSNAVNLLKTGGVIAMPTDTLFGLGADVINETALRKVFDIKGRPADLALPVLVSDWKQVSLVAEGLSEAHRRLASAFWPGCLTIILPKARTLSSLVTAGRDTVAVRMPDHWVPLGLASGLGRPITGTSANRSGQPNLETVQEIEAVLGEAVDMVIAEGPEPEGLQSTIVDLTSGYPALLREGAASFAEVERVWESVSSCAAPGAASESAAKRAFEGANGKEGARRQ